MFSNIGKKIKTLAAVICWLQIIGFVIVAIIQFVLASQMGGSGATIYIITGVLTLIVGPLAAWIGSFLLYGYGELIDKTADVERNTYSILRLMHKSDKEYGDNAPTNDYAYQQKIPTQKYVDYRQPSEPDIAFDDNPQQAGAQPNRPVQSAQERIENLRRLRTQGLITEEEFRQAISKFS